MKVFKLIALIVILAMVFSIFAYIYELSRKPEQMTNATVNKTEIKTNDAQVIKVLENSTVYVEIKGSMFDNPELKVINGTTVRWKNMDSATYVIHVDNTSSPPLNKRDTWNYTFNKAGIFEYNCSLHPGMPKGRIIVDGTG
ncbi:Uncharacterised protein [uncultured archaeon]|nr:Uncharacterised protein [uncultured archaeon]